MRTIGILCVVAAVILGPIASTGYAFCPDGLPGVGARVQMKGTHYDASSQTKVRCDSQRGDFFIVSSCATCSSPPSLGVDIAAITPECQPIQAIRDSFATLAVWGSEIQVVKNGVAKNQCVFHGATDDGTSSHAAYWYAHTIKSFDAAGKLTSEKGVMTFNTYDGRIFIGKIAIKYP